MRLFNKVAATSAALRASPPRTATPTNSRPAINSDAMAHDLRCGRRLRRTGTTATACDQTASDAHLQVVAIVHVDSLQVEISGEWEEHSVKQSTEHGQSTPSCEDRYLFRCTHTPVHHGLGCFVARRLAKIVLHLDPSHHVPASADRPRFSRDTRGAAVYLASVLLTPRRRSPCTGNRVESDQNGTRERHHDMIFEHIAVPGESAQTHCLAIGTGDDPTTTEYKAPSASG